MKLAFSLFLLSALPIIIALPSYDSDGSGSSKSCNGLIVRLNLLGANLNAEICNGKSENLDYSSKVIEKLNCNELVLAVEALGIKVKAGLCLNSGSGSKGSHNYESGSRSPGNKYEQGYQDDNNKDYPGDSGGGNGVYESNNGGGGRVPTCNGIVAKLRALGINIDANVCLGGKDGNGGSKYPPLSGGSTCPDLVADLRLLGIPVKAEICLGGGRGNNSGGGGNRCAIGANVGVSKLLGVDLCVGGSGDNNGGYPGNGGNGNGSHPTCQDIRAKVQLLGIKVDANVCLGGKNSGPNAPVLSNKSGCPTLVANAKLLGILNIDLALCLKVNINLGLKRRSISKRILATR